MSRPSPDIDAIAASITAAADNIVAGFERDRIPTMIAIAIAGAVVGRLLDKLPQPQREKTRREFIECLEP